jgi:hypothetical protein
MDTNKTVPVRISPNPIKQAVLEVRFVSDDWNGIVIGESKIEVEKSEQIHLPAFKKNYKVKMRVRNAGRLQPPHFSNPENV